MKISTLSLEINHPTNRNTKITKQAKITEKALLFRETSSSTHSWSIKVPLSTSKSRKQHITISTSSHDSTSVFSQFSIKTKCWRWRKDRWMLLIDESIMGRMKTEIVDSWGLWLQLLIEIAMIVWRWCWFFILSFFEARGRGSVWNGMKL